MTFVFEHLGRGLLGAVAPRTIPAMEAFAQIIRNRRLRVCDWKGSAPEVGSFSIQTVGSDTSFLGYLHRMVERSLLGSPSQGAPQCPRLDTIERTSIRTRELVTRALVVEHDMAFVEIPRWGTAPFRQAGWHVLPKRVGHQQHLERPDGHFSRRLRRIASKDHLHSAVSRDVRELCTFYETMYVPMLRVRHADLARPTPLWFLRRSLRTGWLLKVMAGGKWMSGAVITPSRSDPRCLEVLVCGVRDGDYCATGEAVRGAPVLFAVDFARANGFRILDHLASPPFLSDGLLKRKLRWGATMVHMAEYSDRIAFCAREGSAAASRFVRLNPLVTLYGDQLRIVSSIEPGEIGAQLPNNA